MKGKDEGKEVPLSGAFAVWDDVWEGSGEG